MPRRSALPCSVAYEATASSSLSGLPILRSGATTRSASACGPQQLTCIRERVAELPAVHDRCDFVQAERERGHHAEVAAAAAQGPQQIRILGSADAQPLAVRRHQLSAQEVVAREPEPAADA